MAGHVEGHTVEHGREKSDDELSPNQVITSDGISPCFPGLANRIRDAHDISDVENSHNADIIRNLIHVELAELPGCPPGGRIDPSE